MTRKRSFRPATAGALLGVLLLTAPAAAQAVARAAPVRVGIYQYPPQGFVDADGTARGFYPEVLGAIAAAEGWRLEYVPCTWVACLERLERGEIDLLGSIAYSEERARRFDFSRRAMLSNWGRLYRNPRVPIESIADLDGLRVAAHREDVYYRGFEKLCGTFGIGVTFLMADDYDGVLRLVESGDADAGVVSRLHGLLFARGRKVLPTTIEFTPTEVRFAAPKGKGGELLAAIDGRLAALQGDRDSVYYRAHDRWFRAAEEAGWRTPRWLAGAAAAAAALLLLSAAASLLLRRQVRRRTADLIRSNDRLRAEVEERRRAEASLAESEARFHAVFDVALDGMLIADLATRRFLFANPAMCRMLGRDPAEIPALKVDDIHPPEALPGVLETFARQSRGELALAEGIPVLHRDGDVMLADINSSPVTIAGRACLLGVFRDTTEHRAIEERLRQSQKMEAIGRLAGGVAHDFNNLLTVIGGTGALLATELGGDDPRRRRVEEILEAAGRAADLTHGLLVLARRQPVVRKPLDARELLGRVRTLLPRIVRDAVEVRVAGGSRELPVVADAAQLEQTLLNLATNARDAMPFGGVLEIRGEALEMPEPFATVHGLGEPGRYVRLEVRDTGIGMDAATQERIFEPFFSTKEPGKGTGLGLASVFGVVAAHHGHIQVASVPGGGTTFRIYLPEARPEDAAAAAGESDGPPAPGEAHGAPSGVTVLLVEDNDALRDLAADAAARAGYRVLTARDGAEALPVFAANAEAIEAVALDIVAPKTRGREVARRMRERKPGLRVLYLSGDDAGFTRLGEVLGDGDRFLAKPFTAGEFLRELRALLGQGPPVGGHA